jgi:ParB family chromosome partitioning protein
LLGQDLEQGHLVSEREIELESIQPNASQPRRTFDQEALAELSESIRQHGVLQPIVVRRKGEGWELIAGERRWRGARLAGLTHIPAVVRDVPDAQMLELALVENVQREDLDPLERAEGYKQLMSQLGLTQDDVARRVGLKRSTIANHLRLLELPPEAKQAVRQGLITMGHARALLGLVRPVDIVGLVPRIAREQLSVRQVEDLVRRRNARGEKQESGSNDAPLPPPWQRELEARMRHSLGCRVRLRNSAGFRGEIVIQYSDRSELDRLCGILAPRREV